MSGKQSLCMSPDILTPALGHWTGSQQPSRTRWEWARLLQLEQRQEHSRAHVSVSTLLERLEFGPVTWSSLKVCVQGSQLTPLSSWPGSLRVGLLQGPD